jgi:C-terminal processing protease CtpA/Prc
MRKWGAAGRVGVIVDIRGVGGTGLSDVVDIAAVFVQAEEEIYRITDGEGNVMATGTCTKSDPLPGAMPVIVATDVQTRDASELLAAVLKGRKGVMLVGLPTYGDDRFREIIPVSASNVLYMATGRIAVGGKGYDSTGVQPQVTVSPGQYYPGAEDLPSDDGSGQGGERTEADRELADRIASDPVLRRAADILLGLNALRRARKPKVEPSEDRESAADE